MEQAGKSERPRQKVEMTRDKCRILVVDNEPEATRLIKLLLENTGDYLVCEENDARRAIETAGVFRPDLVLLDIVMPEADGGEVAEEMEADARLQGTPIIFLTALATKQEADAGMKIQGHPFLAKPITIGNLIDAIERHLPHVRR